MNQMWISATLLCAAVACGWLALRTWRDRAPAGLSVADIQDRLDDEQEALSHAAPTKPLTEAHAREAVRIHRDCNPGLCPRLRAAHRVLAEQEARSHMEPAEPLTETQAREAMQSHRHCDFDACGRLRAAWIALSPTPQDRRRRT